MTQANKSTKEAQQVQSEVESAVGTLADRDIWDELLSSQESGEMMTEMLEEAKKSEQDGNLTQMD